MGISLTIKDQITGISQVVESVIEFQVECISVRELIEARVESEVIRYNKRLDTVFVGLVQPTELETSLNGGKEHNGSILDVDKQRHIAISAFKNRQFFLLINDKQVTDLEEQIMITSKTNVLFLKLVPLAGG